jgi:hypothetical protein
MTTAKVVDFNSLTDEEYSNLMINMIKYDNGYNFLDDTDIIGLYRVMILNFEYIISDSKNCYEHAARLALRSPRDLSDGLINNIFILLKNRKPNSRELILIYRLIENNKALAKVVNKS